MVNTNNKLVQSAFRLADKQPEIAQELTRQIYDLSRMAQKETEAAETEQIIARNQQLLERLAALIAYRVLGKNSLPDYDPDF